MVARSPLAAFVPAVLVPAALMLAARIAAADDSAARRVERATVALLWVDTERADPLPLLAKLRVAAEDFDPPPALATDTAELIARLPEAEREADRWRRSFLDAGGHEVWWLLHFHLAFPAVTVVVPVPEGADAERLLALTAHLDPFGGGEPVALDSATLAGTGVGAANRCRSGRRPSRVRGGAGASPSPSLPPRAPRWHSWRAHPSPRTSPRAGRTSRRS